MDPMISNRFPTVQAERVDIPFRAGRKRSPVFFNGLIFVVAIGLLALTPPSPAQNEEPWAKMLAGLKERQYFDTAVEYLDWMRTSPMCTTSLRRQLDYQIAKVHLDAMQEHGMFLSPEQHLKACRESLEKYLKDRPDGDFAFDAQSTLGRLSMEEGRRAIARSEDAAKPADRQSLRLQARGDFQKALPFFEAADKLAIGQAKKLQAMQKANPAAVKEDALMAAYGRFLAGKIMINLAKSDVAKTYPNDAKEFKDGLTAVAKSFDDLAKKYSSYAAGFDAKLYAARTYKDLGDFKSARAILEELNVLQGEAFMHIRAESLLLALEMNLLDKKPENYLDSITRARSWNDGVPASAKRSREGQRIFLLGARNFIAYADTVQSNKAEYDRARRDAGIFLRQVRGDLYPALGREARDLLQSIGAVKINRDKPENYEQAKEFADEDWRSFIVAYTEYNEAPATEKDKTKARLTEIADACEASFDRAIRMREEGTPTAEINAMRLNLVRVFWIQGRLLEAALLADYLAQHYKNAGDADKTAVMAIRLYRQIFVEEKLAGHDPSAIAERLDKLSRFVVTEWKDQAVVEEVQLLQIETAIDNGEIDEAKRLLTGTTEGTPQRVSAELKIGQSLWNRYALLSRLPEGAEDKPDKKTLDDLLADARKQLELGLNGKLKLMTEGKAKADPASIQCAMAFAQICLNADESRAAIDWLTNPAIGPLTLAAAPPSPSLTDLLKSLQLPATMVVLRAYVATENLDKAEETMNRLEKIIEEQGADEQRLTQIYVSLGRQLEDRLKELNEAGDAEQADKVAKGFEMFLKRIRGRGKENTFQSLYWVADTFYRLGSGMSTDKSVPEEAKNYYKSAGATYVDILKRVADEPDWAPERAEDTIKTRLAESLRCIGLYKNAMDYLSVLLEDSENRIDIQIEAAKTLEAWGKEDPLMLARAVVGRYPEKTVWGWKGLIKRTSANIDKYSDIYYEAYLSMFRCAVDMARAEKERAKREKLIADADRNFRGLLQMRPQLGGPEWFARFDQVYRSLERVRGSSRPAGLKAVLARMSDTLTPRVALDDEIAVEHGAPPAGKQDTKTTVRPAKPKPAAAKQDSSDTMLYVGMGVVVLFIPVAAFLFFGKKKKR